MAFQDFVKNAKKDFTKQFSEHNRLVRQIQGLYSQVWKQASDEDKGRVKAIHEECQNKIKQVKLKLEAEMNKKFEEEVSKLELEYMRKEINVLELWKGSQQAKGAISIITKK